MKRTLYLLLFLATACYRVADRIDPRVDYCLQDRHFQNLQGAFVPLTETERLSDWGKEYTIARVFADQLDLYRAVSTFKRAEILLPAAEKERKLEIQYDILLCYFLGKRYDEAVDAFEKSSLAHVDKSFSSYHDLMLVLYECYKEMDNPEKQQRILELIKKTYPDSGEALQISRAIREGTLPELSLVADNSEKPPYLNDLVSRYQIQKKSVAKAQTLNALLPGAGYFYIGQKKSAFTALLLNSLFIAAAYQFFHHGHTAAGIITTSFEAGWYFGGIYGAGEEAKYYNERMYEKIAGNTLNEQNLFPVLMLQHAF